MLQTLDSLASVLTAVVATVYWAQVQWTRRDRRLRLEKYLADEISDLEPGQRGAHSLTHLVARLGMSESDVMDAAYRSKKVRRLVRADPQTGIAAHVALAYDRAPPPRF